jgi:hypothetical protein
MSRHWIHDRIFWPFGDERSLLWSGALGRLDRTDRFHGPAAILQGVAARGWKRHDRMLGRSKIEGAVAGSKVDLKLTAIEAVPLERSTEL